MSDDYVTMDVPDNMTYEQIDALVETMNYFLENDMDEDEIKIVTDGKPRELKCFMDLTEKERADFDYIEEDDFYSPRLVKYKGHWYDVDDTQRICTYPKGHLFDFAVNLGHPFAKWDCITTETFFSGVLFRYTKDYENVVCGSYCT